jgi:chromosome segregation ATPase
MPSSSSSSPRVNVKVGEIELKKYQEMEGKFKEIKFKYAEVQKQLNKLNEDKNNYVKTSETCQITITELNASLKDTKERLDKSLLEGKLGKEALEKAQNEWKTQSDSLQSSINDLQVRNVELEKRLETVMNDNVLLEADRAGSEKKCEVLEKDFEKCYVIYKQELETVQAEREQWRTTETNLLTELKLSKGQIENLKIAVQAEKSARICAEEKVHKKDDTIAELNTKWEVKYNTWDQEYKAEIQRLEQCLRTYINKPDSPVDITTNKLVIIRLKTIIFVYL